MSKKISASSKSLNRLVSQRDIQFERQVLSSNELRISILRERDRADRREIPFSLILVTTKTEDETVKNESVAYLKSRLRFTDEIGIVSKNVVAILLPDTEPDAACSLCAEIGEHFETLDCKFRLEIFSYPDSNETFLSDDDLESELVTNQPNSIYSSSELPDAISEPQSLSFAISMPVWKRSLDLIVSTIALLLLSPVMLITALLVKLTSRGPIFFTQWREGKGGRKFRIYKFRTMVVNAESLQNELRSMSEQDGPAFKIEKDPRLTWIGRILRKSCIDETPQLINILKGEMTLVGPRPLPVNESMACTRWQRRRLDVTPGMTCTWQVHGDRHVSFDEWMRMDETYIREASLAKDFGLLFRTGLFVLMRKASV